MLAVILLIILAISVVSDLRTQKIPNKLTFPAVLFIVAYQLVLGSYEGFLLSLGGMVLGIAIFFIPYLMGGMGAGDAKLMGVVGAAIGAKGVVVVTLYTAVIGGFYALVLLIKFKGKIKVNLKQNQPIRMGMITAEKNIAGQAEVKRPKLCYGVAIALGTFLYLGLEGSHIGQIL